MLDAVPEVLGIPPEHVVAKTRRRQRFGAQYENQGRGGSFLEVREGGLSFLVNLNDYIDTGLFLDMRIGRRMIREAARGCSFLNLFSYTGSATVYAAAGGARKTMSVDSSNTYTEWARDNMGLNGFVGPEHQYARADARSWLRRSTRGFDLAFLDPPTFSRSKGHKRPLQIQQDHVELIELVMRRLSDRGVLFFATNYARFRLDTEPLNRYELTEITDETISPDFARRPRIHRMWRITRKRG
jgi:23S rRNA (guanine2445-N2)-methyltransferase / 23S rRNA (guanine2069-N7)-methyltransferase